MTQSMSGLTLRYSTGLVTLNLSMVEIMMAGVVRKNSKMNRMQLMMKQRIHQEIPPSDRCSLEKKRSRQNVLWNGQSVRWTELTNVPANVLWVGCVRNAPIVNMEGLAELR